ncbi:hypothetical protein COBT_001965 [Conglomerata obtusa]
MILKAIVIFFLIGISGTEERPLEEYNIGFFVDTIKQLNKDACSSANNCLKRNEFNQYICISAPINGSSNFLSISRMYTVIIESYKKIIKNVLLSVLAVERNDQHIITNQKLCHYVFSYYCNMISTIVEDKQIYHFNNQFLRLTYSSYKSTTTAYDLSKVLSKKNYNMIIFENCINTEDDITFLYKISSDYEKKYGGLSEQLQIVFALKFENKGEVDAWNKLKINNAIYIASKIIFEQKINFLNLSIADVDNDTLVIKRIPEVDRRNQLDFLRLSFNILKESKYSKRNIEQFNKYIYEKYSTVCIKRAANHQRLKE